MNNNCTTVSLKETTSQDDACLLNLWRIRSFANVGSELRWVVERRRTLRSMERVENAASRTKKFRSKAAALEAMKKLNGPPTHWVDERGLSVTNEFLQSKGDQSDWRDVYTIACIMLDGKLFASPRSIDGAPTSEKSQVSTEEADKPIFITVF